MLFTNVKQINRATQLFATNGVTGLREGEYFPLVPFALSASQVISNDIKDIT